MSGRLVVDPVRCTAARLCAELLPEAVSLDEWGYPVVDGRALDGRTLRLARKAAAACPVRALLLLDVPAPRAAAD
ncbi:ferredoxin [Pseudonocardia sp.]|uniref:ferredoxin n=1 Tax=Pseudonocardia sp. TaxID=60912 RepID=UPI003D0A52F6